MGNQSLSLCQRQNQQSKNKTEDQYREIQKAQKISLHTYSSPIKNSALSLSIRDFQKVKRCPQIDKIYQFLIARQAVKHLKYDNNQRIHKKNQQKNQNSQKSDFNSSVNHHKIYLQRSRGDVQQNNRNSKHLTFDKNYSQLNTNQPIQENDQFYQQMMPFKNSLDIFDQQYICKGIYDSNDKLNGSLQLYSFLTGQSQKFVQAQFQNGIIKSSDVIIISKSGSFYRGGFHNNQFNGKGLLHLQNGVQFNGFFKDGFLQGKGKKIQIDGGIFQGIFRKGKRQGKGRILWKQNKHQNLSNITFSQGQNFQPKEIIFDGYFKDDKINGLGHLKTPNYEYWGPFIDNLKQGKGTMIFFPQKTKFEGWFQKDQIKGYGVKFFMDGSIQKGYFGNNK